MPSSYQFALWKKESFLVPPAFFRNLLVGPDSASPEDSGPGASVTNPTQAESLGTLAFGAQDLSLCRRKEP